MIEKLKKQHPLQNGSMTDTGAGGKNSFKKKRPRNETAGPRKTASTSSHANPSPISYGVYAGGYTAKQGNPSSSNTHVGPTNNTKEGSQLKVGTIWEGGWNWKNQSNIDSLQHRKGAIFPHVLEHNNSGHVESHEKTKKI
jgi:hypothetical protein